MTDYNKVYEDRKNLSKNLKKYIKSLGFKANDVSCRYNKYSMGSSHYIDILNPKLPKETIENYCLPLHKVDRCEVTGEILGGCNHYVFVKHDKKRCMVQILQLPEWEEVFKKLCDHDWSDNQTLVINNFRLFIDAKSQRLNCLDRGSDDRLYIDVCSYDVRNCEPLSKWIFPSVVFEMFIYTNK